VAELTIECPASYPPGCKIVFVGEAPGRDEVEKKEGFVGAAGRVLQRACGIAGLEWASCGRSNVAKRRPPNNKFREAFYETIKEPIYTKTGKLSKRTNESEVWTAELQEWVDFFAEELQQHNPNLIVAAGNEALSAITGISGITDYRGSILESRGAFVRADGSPLKVLAVEHPSYILRGQFLDFWILCQDLKKAKREMEFPDIRRECFDVTTKPTLVQALFALDCIRWEPTHKWSLDVETRAGTLACFAVAHKNWSNFQYEATCIPIQTSSGPYWSPEDELEIWRALHATTRANPNLCNQFIVYDIDYLLQYGIEPSGVYMSTDLAHRLLYPEFPMGLDFLCSFYLDDVVYYKGKSTKTDEEMWTRCVEDVVYTLRIVDKIDAELIRKRLYKFYHGFDSPWEMHTT
jgi:uracil-DNA glycosylase